MPINIVPVWMSELEEEDVIFMKRFILASGSLKEIAKQYNVTYPTVRLRLNKLIEKIKIYDKEKADPFISLIKTFVVDEKVEFDAAKILISEYKKRKGDF